MISLSGAPTILIVEDQSIVALDIQEQLSASGYVVVGRASRGLQAVELARELQPELVLMDIQLAGEMDGITAAQKIRIELHIPVVFVTSFYSDEVIARAKLSEPFGYLLKPFTEREMATVIELALYKHKAESKLRANMELLQRVSRRVLEVQESERRRIAIELHDQLGQSLTAIKINLQSVELFKDRNPAELNAETVLIVEDAIEQIHRISLALRPSILDDLGLVPAIQWLAEQASVRSGFTLRFEHENSQDRFSSEIETACFRIVQEALTNIARYANAKFVKIDLTREQDTLRLSITDDGQGFNLDEMYQQAKLGMSLGVYGMRERAMLIGGELAITSAMGQGCTVHLQCPLHLQEAL